MRFLSVDTDKKISKIGLGAWQFGSREWGYGDPYAVQEARSIVRRAVELGVTLFDTAEIYGFGRSERILGEALGEDRGSVFVATKIFPLLPVAPVVEQRAVASAARLGVHRIDLDQVHQPHPVVRDGTIMRGMRALQRVGLVAEAGVSNYSLKRWRAAEAALGSRVLSNQVSYSLADRAPERELVPFAGDGRHVVIAYSPLGQGLLSGRYDRDHRPANQIRAANPLFLPGNLERAAGLLATLREVADAHDASPPRSPWPGSSGIPAWPPSPARPASGSWRATSPPRRSTSPTANTRRCGRPRTGSGPSPAPPRCRSWSGPASAADRPR